MPKASREDLYDLHGVVARELKARLETGEATAAEITAALKFLESNDVRNINSGEVISLAEAIADIDEKDLPQAGLSNGLVEVKAGGRTG